MDVLSFNVNGIRSAIKKGLVTWLKDLAPDVICLQETRALPEQWAPESIFPNYRIFHNPAIQPGYAGVTLLVKNGISYRHAPEISSSLPLQDEGRILGGWLNDTVLLLNCYWPSGTSSDIRQSIKLTYLQAIYNFIKSLPHPIILVGDLNLAHTEYDLTNWKANWLYPGFTPQEREWMTSFLKDCNLVDTFRVLNEPSVRAYTWWSQRGASFAKDVGWRIDYQLISDSLKNAIQEVKIFKEPRFSDHAAYWVRYNLGE